MHHIPRFEISGREPDPDSKHGLDRAHEERQKQKDLTLTRCQNRLEHFGKVMDAVTGRILRPLTPEGTYASKVVVNDIRVKRHPHSEDIRVEVIYFPHNKQAFDAFIAGVRNACDLMQVSAIVVFRDGYVSPATHISNDRDTQDAA
jgi:hypothetical protein